MVKEQRRILSLWLCVALVLRSVGVAGQLFSYTQPQETPVIMNPAFVGNSDFVRVNFSFRNQWFHVKSPYNTFSLTFDTNFGAYQNHAVAFSILSDIEGKGVLHHTSILGYYAYAWDVAYNFRLRMGVGAGFAIKGIDYDELVFPDMVGAAPGEYEPATYHNTTRFAPDFALGISGELENWEFGVAAHHIAEPSFDVRNTNYLRLERKLTAHVSYRFNVFEYYRFKPPLYITPHLVAMQQGRRIEIALGGAVEYLGVKAAVWVRETVLYVTHNVAGSFGWEGNRFGIYYAYNMSILPQGLYGVNTSVHELGMVVKFPTGGSYYNNSLYNQYAKKRYVRYNSKRAASKRYRRRR